MIKAYEVSPWLWNMVPLLSVLILNYGALIHLEPHFFQRLGTIWICIGILIIARYIRKWLAFSEQIRELKQRASAISSKKNAAEEGKTIGDKLNQLNTEVSREFASLTVCEALLLAVGTIQTGYGDLFHCWYNGNGWTTC